MYVGLAFRWGSSSGLGFSTQTETLARGAYFPAHVGLRADFRATFLRRRPTRLTEPQAVSERFPVQTACGGPT
ncbi:hypothetical protein AB4144_55280, partial [Rhizobiaceae sp. 2RAB30]